MLTVLPCIRTVQQFCDLDFNSEDNDHTGVHDRRDKSVLCVAQEQHDDGSIDEPSPHRRKVESVQSELSRGDSFKVSG